MGLRREHAAKVLEIRADYVRNVGVYNWPARGLPPTTKAFETERYRWRREVLEGCRELIGAIESAEGSVDSPSPRLTTVAS